MNDMENKIISILRNRNSNKFKIKYINKNNHYNNNYCFGKIFKMITSK